MFTRTFLRSWDGTVSITTGYMLDDRGSESEFEAHPAFDSVRTGGSFLGGKAAKA
jgi:hypothetical protein